MFRNVWSIATVALVVGLLIAGCGAPAPPPAETEGPPPTQPPEATPEPTSTEATAEPKVAVYLMPQDFIDLDPGLSFARENVVINLCYENLTYYAPPGSDELVLPGLATSWETNEDATEWTFYLREGVTFQDGEPFTAEAVKATLQHFADLEGAGCSWIWSGVEEVEVIDDYTVKINMTYPAPVDLMATASYCGGIMSPNIVDQPKEWFDEGNCVGTGPYYIESFDKGQRLVMTQFEDYWKGWEDDRFDKVVYEIVGDQVVALQMIEAGEADVLRDVAPDKLESLRQNPDLQVLTHPSFVHTMFAFNTQKPPLDDPLVREALVWSYPYDELVERSEGLWVQSRGAIPAAMWGYCEDCFQYYQDLDKARDLLAQAGYPDGGFDLLVTHIPKEYQKWPVELWAAPLEELGITMKAQEMQFQSQWELAKSDPQTAQDVFTSTWWPSWVTPYDDLLSLYHCEDTPFFNMSYWCNEEFDAIIDEANELTGTDIEAAEQMFIDAQKILLDEHVRIFLADNSTVSVMSKDIEGFVDNPAYAHVFFWHDISTSR